METKILPKMTTAWVDEKPWSSPDGKVTIWKIKLEDEQGERELYSTMSKAIAELGWTGDIELYENAKGKQYVRKAPKPDTPAGGREWVDHHEDIKAEWALGHAYTAHSTIEHPKGKEDWQSIVNDANKLYNLVERVKQPLTAKE